MSVQQQIESLRVQRAAEWYELMTSGEANEADNREFQSWLAESPLNGAALLKLTALSRELRAAVQEQGFNREVLLKDLRGNAVSFLQTPSDGARSVSSRRWTKRTRWLSVAAIVIVSLAGTWFWGGREWLQTEHYVTAAGEQRTIGLTDGSVIYLNSKSKLRVALSPHSREFFLNGEALFQVAHDPQRPFEVRTDDALVRAIGTAFNVAIGRDGTRVAVIEGKVQVSSQTNASRLFDFRPQPTMQPTRLQAGEAIRVSRNGAIERQPAAEVQNAIAWRQHLIVIDGMTLEQAVEEFNKYQRHLRLRVEKVTPGSHHYSGTFDALNPQAFAAFLSQERDLIVEQRADEIVIRPR